MVFGSVSIMFYIFPLDYRLFVVKMSVNQVMNSLRSLTGVLQTMHAFGKRFHSLS